MREKLKKMFLVLQLNLTFCWRWVFWFLILGSTITSRNPESATSVSLKPFIRRREIRAFNKTWTHPQSVANSPRPKPAEWKLPKLQQLPASKPAEQLVASRTLKEKSRNSFRARALRFQRPIVAKFLTNSMKDKHPSEDEAIIHNRRENYSREILLDVIAHRPNLWARWLLKFLIQNSPLSSLLIERRARDGSLDGS